MITIQNAIDQYLESVRLARSARTAVTYANAMHYFIETLQRHGLDTEKDDLSRLNEDAITWLAQDLKSLAATTERLYLTAATGFYSFLTADNLANVNLPRIKMLIQQRARRPGQRLPQFPVKAIEKVLLCATDLSKKPYETSEERLINLRDRAFLLTLADTGLRVHEACALRRGDLDWNEGKAMIIGKGNRQDIVRFSTRATDALSDYLNARRENRWLFEPGALFFTALRTSRPRCWQQDKTHDHDHRPQYCDQPRRRVSRQRSRGHDHSTLISALFRHSRVALFRESQTGSGAGTA